MEMIKKTDNLCSLGGDMLAYLYDELSWDGRERFESHLADCSLCIDEFAELSDARYSVYEWKNVEFAPLPTPRFVIPVETVPAGVSWLDSVRAGFGWNGAAALTGVFALLVVVVLGFAMYLNSTDVPVLTNVEQPRSSAPAAPAAPPANNPVETAQATKPEVEAPNKATVPVRRAERETVAVRTQQDTVKAKPVRPARAETVQTRKPPANRRLDNSPTLGQYVEDRDESLRLSDLFDDLDSRELD